MYQCKVNISCIMMLWLVAMVVKMNDVYYFSKKKIGLSKYNMH